MLEYLETELIASLNGAKSISIAVALMKDYGFSIIENNLPKECTRKYLVGINLPTPPNILRRLLELQKNNPNHVVTKVYASRANYHPKVYLIEKKSGDLIAFVGSANATRGGLTHNIEMSFAITDSEDCVKLKAWFDSLFITAKSYDEKYISNYEVAYKKNRLLASTQKSNISQVTDNNQPVVGHRLIISLGQFFRQSDFDAFAVSNQMIKTQAVVDLRAEVKERLIELAEEIVPYFAEYGITDLHLGYRRNLYTSQHFHSGRSRGPKESIWLQFGKSHAELMRYEGKFYQSITNHERIQVILRNTDQEAYIGIWLYLSKQRSSYFDREKLKRGLDDTNFIARLYEYVLALGGSYWLMMGNDEIWVSDLENSQQLVAFFLQDNYTQEIIIGRNYDPNDIELSEENITETVLVEFSKLYKIYDLIKAPAPTT